MAHNISRFFQVDKNILLEYIINNQTSLTGDSDDVINSNTINAQIATQINGEKVYIDTVENFVAPLNKTEWIVDGAYESLLPEKENINGDDIIPFDIIKLHIVSGYNFSDVYGFLLQIRTKDNDGKNVNLKNWLYRRNNNKDFIQSSPMIVSDKIYDKYIEIKIPSVKYLRSITSPTGTIKQLSDALNISYSNSIENIEIQYSMIDKKSVVDNKFFLDDYLVATVPFDSPADDFNIHISESPNGNFVNFYTTWAGNPITNAIINMFNTRIKLYATNGLDYDYDAAYYDDVEIQDRWMIIHELTTSFFRQPYGMEDRNMPVEVMMPQTYILYQKFNGINDQTSFNYKPIIDKNLSETIDYIVFNYTARLVNRYDGTQIVRSGSISTDNVAKYLDTIYTLNRNLSSYKIYNKKIINDSSININAGKSINRYIKLYYNASDIKISKNNEYLDPNDYTQLINRKGGLYLFNLISEDINGNLSKVSLDNICSYILTYTDANGADVVIDCTYSDNMNLLNGQLEFNITPTIAASMMNVSDSNKYLTIMARNIDGSLSTICEMKYKFN
jgi:hypothetical protein